LSIVIFTDLDFITLRRFEGKPERRVDQASRDMNRTIKAAAIYLKHSTQGAKYGVGTAHSRCVSLAWFLGKIKLY
jgi:hypothetical protein